MAYIAGYPIMSDVVYEKLKLRLKGLPKAEIKACAMYFIVTIIGSFSIIKT